MHRRSGRALALCLALFPGSTPAEEDSVATYLGSYHWRAPHLTEFGGLSGIDLYADGRRFVAVSDHALLYRGQLLRGPGGQVTGVEVSEQSPLLSNRGRPIYEVNGEAEGVALAADGSLWISTEGYHVVNRVAPDDHVMLWIDAHPDFNTFPGNAGLEALATDPQGRPLTWPERVPQGASGFPVYRLEPDNQWHQPYSLPRQGRFLPVGADLGPDDRLYVLERRNIGPLLFSSRVRSFAFSATGLRDARTHLVSRWGRHDNLEGLSVWRDGSGARRLTMISDDNFFVLERTEIVEYRLSP